MLERPDMAARVGIGVITYNRKDVLAETRYGLVGVGLGGFRVREAVSQRGLFDHLDDY